jgi:Tfp pilus assembly protein PilO
MSLWRRVFTERRGVVLPVVVALLAMIGVLVLGVLPLKRAVVSAQENALEERANLANARKEDMQAKAARTGKERADTELAKFYAEILPTSYGGAIDILDHWLGDAAEEVQLRFRSGQWDTEDVRDSSLTKVTGKVTLTGDYNNIRKFLYNLETATEFVIVESVELSQSNVNQANSALEVAMSVATYYVSPASKAAASKASATKAGGK